jgi:hypothetical protein
MWFSLKAPKRKEKSGKLDFFAIEKLSAEGVISFCKASTKKQWTALNETTRKRWNFGTFASSWTTTTQERKTRGKKVSIPI